MKILLAARPEKDCGLYCGTLEYLGAPYIQTLKVDTDCSGLLLPGGVDVDPAFYGEKDLACRDVDRELDEKQMELTEAFVRAGKPVFGICRGCQLLNVVFGGTLIQDLATAESHRSLPGEVKLHPVTAVPGSLLASLYGVESVVNSSHHQACDRIGKGFRVTQRAEDGVVEAIEGDGVFGVQWHPEKIMPALRVEGAVDGAVVLRRFLELSE